MVRQEVRVLAAAQKRVLWLLFAASHRKVDRAFDLQQCQGLPLLMLRLFDQSAPLL